MDISITKPNEEPLRQEIMPLAERATSMVVSDKPSHELAQNYLVELTKVERSVKELFSTPKSAAHKAHREICAAEKKLLDPIAGARRKVSGAIGSYEAEQRRLADIERRKREEEARKAEEDRALKAAEELEAAGEHELAEQVLTEDIEPPVIAEPEPELAKVDNVHTRTTYSCEVTDLRALIRYVAERPELTDLLQPSMTQLNQLARALRHNMKVPGVRLIESKQAVVRT
jgi:type I site-specific restriction endonuclease